MHYGREVRLIGWFFGRGRHIASRELVRKVKTALVALLCGLSLAGCASGRAWKEEVVMFDGRKVVVERQQTLGNPLDRELSEVSLSRPPVTGNFLRVPLNNGGWSPIWEGPGLNPLALGKVGPDYFLAAWPVRCHNYDKWGRPVPPYVFFRFDGHAWQRVNVDAFPKEIDRLNMSLPGTDAHRAAVASGYVSAEGVPMLNFGAPDYIRTIKRAGTAGVEDCLHYFELQQRARKK